MRITYTTGGGVLIELDGGCIIQQDVHPTTGEKITAANVESAAKACLSGADFVAFQKMRGIEFGGVMCSATKDDQAGLVAVLVSYQLQGGAFKTTTFEFSNGSTLAISKDNIQAFIAAWMPFRGSFFAAEGV